MKKEIIQFRERIIFKEGMDRLSDLRNEMIEQEFKNQMLFEMYGELAKAIDQMEEGKITEEKYLEIVLECMKEEVGFYRVENKIASRKKCVMNELQKKAEERLLRFGCSDREIEEGVAIYALNLQDRGFEITTQEETGKFDSIKRPENFDEMIAIARSLSKKRD